MLPELPASTGTTYSVKMLAIIEQWEEVSGSHTDNTEKYLLLVLFKFGMDAVVFYLCRQKPFTSFFSMCSLSIILADFVMAFLLAMVWLLGVERSPVSLCFILADASATYAAMPLPLMILGLLDYCLVDTYICNQNAFCKILGYAVLTLLGWMLAVIYSTGFVKGELMELNNMAQTMALVCEVKESPLVSYSVLVLFIAVVCTMLPFWSSVPQWVKEADRLSDIREEKEYQKSDLFMSTGWTETRVCKKNNVEENIPPPPFLWLSLTLGFSVFWLPYLMISVACLVFDFGAPAYITVNVLWLECVNSLVMGIVFWAKSNMRGPYSRLPENVCLWHVYYHLSKGAQQRQIPIAVFNPSKGKRTTLFYV